MNKTGTVVGIDVGLKGAIAAISDFNQDVHLYKMPIIGKTIITSVVIDILKQHQPRHVFVEHSQAIPHTGSTTSAFNFGAGFGKLIGIIETLKIPLTLVKPRSWQSEMLRSTSKNINTKKRALIVATRLFPQTNFILERCRVAHDGAVDAALIAEYGRRKIKR